MSDGTKVPLFTSISKYNLAELMIRGFKKHKDFGPRASSPLLRKYRRGARTRVVDDSADSPSLVRQFSRRLRYRTLHDTPALSTK